MSAALTEKINKASVNSTDLDAFKAVLSPGLAASVELAPLTLFPSRLCHGSHFFFLVDVDDDLPPSAGFDSSADFPSSPAPSPLPCPSSVLLSPSDLVLKGQNIIPLVTRGNYPRR